MEPEPFRDVTLAAFIFQGVALVIYVFTSNRFLLAMAMGAVVGMGVGTYSTATGAAFDVNMATVCLVTFFIGFFPDQGLSIWQQSRFGQAGDRMFQ